ncbi:MAG: LysM peptidoglycan-binding domain-containing protein [Chloroflexota bacterium]
MLAKACIVNCDNEKEYVVCMFNPKEYTFSKQNKWEEKPVKGQNVSHLEYSGGGPATLKLQLLFDTTEVHYSDGKAINRVGDDVRKYTELLWKLMKVPQDDKNPRTEKGEPPRCRFVWGKQWSFEAVIESISQKFVLFDTSGTPLRAILDVSFKQSGDEGIYPRQNPTSGGAPGQRLRTVREGETLALIAYEEYGDPTVWRHLADTNNLDDPRRLRPGQTLLITPLPLL